MTDTQGASATTPLPMHQQHDQLLLGRYRVMSSGAEGGFGTVLTCWDTRLQRRVAIKRMPLARPDMPAGSASAIEEALAEARTSCLLAHPNIVTVFDFESDVSFAYLVMEYIDGLTLTELLSRVEGGTLTTEECAYLIGSVAKALEFAHENGVLHLDLKPSNIMIDHTGTVKLCDFGMATLASATGYGGARGGTVGYMPPEQILGDVVDERSDVFSLAVVAWQALTGQSPFAAPSAGSSLALIERGARPALSKLVPETEGMAEEVIMQALSANRSTRTPSVDVFARELVFGLGSPAEGAASIRELLEQASPEERTTEAQVKNALPFAYRHPKLGPTALRIATAALTVPPAMAASAVLFSSDERGQALTCALVAACSAAWPPAAPLLALGMIVFTLLSSAEGAVQASLPIASFVVLAVWWLAAGRKSHLSGLAVLPACLLETPLVAPSVCAFGLTPGCAALTGIAAWCIQAFYAACLETSFNVTHTAPLLHTTMLTNEFFIGMASAGFAGAIGAAITRHWGTVAAGIAGQIICLALIVGTQIATIWMKNDAIWQALNSRAVALGVLLSILACIATALRGPLSADEEVGLLDELT